MQAGKLKGYAVSGLKRSPLAPNLPTLNESGIAGYDEQYGKVYRTLMLAKLGFEVNFEQGDDPLARELLKVTIELLHKSQMGYHEFFAQLAVSFSREWRLDQSLILAELVVDEDIRSILENWRGLYFAMLQARPESDLEAIALCLNDRNPAVILTRPQIEAVWDKIDQEDDWSAFNELLNRIQHRI